MSDVVTTSIAHIRTELARTEPSAPDRICLTSSFQSECVVLLHLLREVRPEIPVLFIDTVHHFAETYAYVEQLTRAWSLNLVTVRAATPVPGLWRSGTSGCCALNKVEPLFKALNDYDVWFTALRREQSPSRAQLETSAPFVLPSGRTIRKLSPLAEWTARDVAAYAHVNEIPLLPLYDQGYTSIGCAPCTQRPTDPSNPRSGRWDGQKLECGIHIEGARPV